MTDASVKRGDPLRQSTFVQRFLESLADGEWHRADVLFPHPQFPYLGLEAVVRVLRAEGHAIEQRGKGSEASYRLEPG